MKFAVLAAILATALLANAAAAAEDVRPSVPGQPAAQARSDELTEYYEPSPAAVVGAFAINVVYVPIRFTVTVIGGFVGGIEGILSGGNVDAVHKVWGLTDGSQVITPAMLEGYEPWRFSRYGW